MPGWTQPFRFIGALGADASNLVFGGSDGATHVGIFAYLDGQLGRIADMGTPAPDGGQFTDFTGVPSISGRNILFEGSSSTHGDGLYMWRDGVMSRIIGLGDSLNGHQIAQFFTSPEALEGDTAAFSILWNDLQHGSLYTVTFVPAPGALALLAAGAIVCRRRRR